MSKNNVELVDEFKSLQNQLEENNKFLKFQTKLEKTSFIPELDKHISTEDIMLALKSKIESANNFESNFPVPDIEKSIKNYKKFLIELFAATEMLSQYEDSLFPTIDYKATQLQEEKATQSAFLKDEIQSIISRLDFSEWIISFKNIDDLESKMNVVLNQLKNQDNLIFRTKGYRLFVHCDNDSLNLLIYNFERHFCADDFAIIKSQINKRY